ncbi:MAG: cupin domain-containing protein [Sphaerochaeta sp.]|jgi:quercetin dioxygenase-like cupin family protein|nr:hypothetical protein [Spirochaetales bacterium]
MIETVFTYTATDEQIIERLVNEDAVMINHVVLSAGERLPEHHSDSNVFMIIVRGTLSIKLDEQAAHTYSERVVQVPFHTKMNIANGGEEAVEFFIVKAPHPRVYKE